MSSTNTNTSGSIITKSTNTDSSLETFDMDFKLCHKKNGETNSTLDTRLILSPGKENHNNENKLILVNPYGSDANEERKSTLQFRGFKNTSVISGQLTAVPNVHNGTAQGGGNSTITLDAGASDVNNTYNNNYIEITDGTGNGQIARITGYVVDVSKVATIEGTWTTNPDNTSVFKITSANPNYVVSLAANSSSNNDYYNTFKITIKDGDCKGQTAIINDYDVTTKVATLNKSWINNITPNVGDTYEIQTFSNMGEIEVFHTGTGNNDKGMMRFNVNDGGDTPDNLHTIMELRPKTSYHSGIAQAGAATTITLDINANAVNDYFNGYYISIISGTGNGQSIKIIDYDGTTKVATIDGSWTTIPDNTSEFEIYDASVTIYGDLNINKTVTSTNSAYKDTLIKLGQELLETPSKDIGIIFTRGNGTSTNQANKCLIWDESLDAFTLVASDNENGQTAGNISIDGYETLQIHKLHLISNSATDANGTGTNLSNQFISSNSTDMTISSSGIINFNSKKIDFSDSNFTLSANESYDSVKMSGGTITEFNGTSTHTLLTTLHLVPPTITNDASNTATVTQASTLYISDSPSSTTGNNYAFLVNSGKTEIRSTTEVKGQFATNVNVSGGKGTFDAATNNPSVANGNLWQTHNSVQTLINFSNGIAGQTIYVLSTNNVTYDVTSTLLKGGQTDIETSNGDLTVWTYDGTNWYLVQFMNQSSNIAQDILNNIKEVSFNTTANSLYLGNGPTPPYNEGDNSLRNTSIGVGALTSITNSNTATECDDNSTFGYNAGNDITTGYSNTCVGSGAGATIINGYNNTCIGEGADINNFGGFNRISIGHGAICEADDEITLGNNIQRIRCSTSVIATVSDERDKKNIEDCEYGEDFLNKIRPRKFTWDKRILNNNDKIFSKNGKEELGFIAQELLESMNENNKDLINLVSETNPKRLEIMSGNLLPIMVKAIQEMSKKIKYLEIKLNIK